MQNAIGIGTIIALSIAAFFAVDYFSTMRALLLTSVGLSISFGWYFAFGKTLQNENLIDGLEQKFSFVDYLFCIGVGLIYFLIVIAVSGIFYVSA